MIHEYGTSSHPLRSSGFLNALLILYQSLLQSFLHVVVSETGFLIFFSSCCVTRSPPKLLSLNREIHTCGFQTLAGFFLCRAKIGKMSFSSSLRGYRVRPADGWGHRKASLGLLTTGKLGSESNTEGEGHPLAAHAKAQDKLWAFLSCTQPFRPFPNRVCKLSATPRLL